jgi:alanyl-tRNA synthetase
VLNLVIMNSNELRRKYLEFFVSKGHAVIASASVVPENDPSVLFTTAGMHPLVPYLMGEPHPAGNRLVNTQKCIRTGDIDEVGDNTHLTFFEMLGNWSLGDYFKQESIKWSYEFLTSKQWLGIDVGKLAFTVYAGDENTPFDEEAYNIWLELGISENRIAKLGKDDNWWPAGGKHLGPQGPDTEIFYWTGDEDVPDKYAPSDIRWVEIWNNVFMQFNRTQEGELLELSQKNVDTGMGLERVVAVLNGKKSPYDTDIFKPMLDVLANISGINYTGQAAMRIVVDHIRTAVIMISDGVLPANKDQGYILRRLVRRAVRNARKMNIQIDKMLEELVEAVDLSLGEVYPNITDKKNDIKQALLAEAGKFEKTLEKGERELRKLWETKNSIDGQDAFNLYQTFGFPFELTEEIAREHGQSVETGSFKLAFEEHQSKSREGAGAKFAGGLVDDSAETTRLHTATHLLHKALRIVLGDHVEQKGSNINQERLRFDFSHGEKMTDEQKAEVEKIVNEQIKRALPVSFELMLVDEAKKQGAIGLFDDKYAQLEGGQIKVYKMGDFSFEICGGPHVANTCELGGFKIAKEEACSAGIRRIKAILG